MTGASVTGASAVGVSIGGVSTTGASEPASGVAVIDDEQAAKQSSARGAKREAEREDECVMREFSQRRPLSQRARAGVQGPCGSAETRRAGGSGAENAVDFQCILM